MIRELKLSQEKLDSYLNKSVDLIVFDTIDSTNSYARNLCLNSSNIANFQGTDKNNSYADSMSSGQISTNQVCLIVADEQTGGRGRLGRSFYSEKGTGLYMTLSLKPSFGLERSMQVTPLVSLAVKEAVHRLTGIDLGIKWVNDLILDGRKVGGILVEAVPLSEAFTHSKGSSLSTSPNGLKEYQLIVGIGLNCYKSNFPDELNDIAISLEDVIDIGKIDFLREQLCANISNILLEYIKILEDDDKTRLGELMNTYRDSSVLIGEEIYVINSALSSSPLLARALDIDDNGALRVLILEGESKDKTLALTTGEVTIRLK